MIVISLCCGVSAASAQRPPRTEVLKLAPYATMTESLGRLGPRFGFGLRAERPVGSGYVRIWGSGAREHLARDCLTLPGVICGSGRAWLGSVGFSAYLFPSRLTPYVGVGVGKRRLDGSGSKENVRTLFLGVDLKGRTRFSLRLEVMRRSDSSGLVVLGFGVAI